MPFLKSLDSYYPDFSHWYINRVIANIDDPTNVILLAKDHNSVVGVALGKKSEDEVKLRCVRVASPYQARGIGLRLIDKMLDELEERNPHCTVSEELLHQYSRIFVNRYGFELSRVDKGRYRPSKLEYCFN